MRTEKLLNIRVEKIGNLSSETSIEEHFQNTTLRPILVLQNDLIILLFIEYAKKQKGLFFSLNIEKKMNYIENVIQKDIKFKNILKGIVIGLFTADEYKQYVMFSSNINKRIIGLIIERLKEHLQVLEPHL